MKRVRIRKGDDMHLHTRTGDMMMTVLPFTVAQFKRVLVMPNTRPKPILNAKDALAYEKEILEAVYGMEIVSFECDRPRQFEPLMTDPGKCRHNAQDCAGSQERGCGGRQDLSRRCHDQLGEWGEGLQVSFTYFLHNGRLWDGTIAPRRDARPRYSRIGKRSSFS